MAEHGHSAFIRSSQMPNSKSGRHSFYIFAICKKCGRQGKSSSTDGDTWTFSDMPRCESLPPAAAAAAPVSAAATELVECKMCSDNTGSSISCAAGHHMCGECFDSCILTFNFTDRQKILTTKQLVVPDLHAWPFMCYYCLEENVCNILPIGTCMSQMSAESTRILFNMLRKFKLNEGDETGRKEVDATELETVRQMVSLLFNPPRCPECLTPFSHDGGCMAMKCRGRPGVMCQVYFCLWCLRVPDQVSLLGPNASHQDCSEACHRHVFMCHQAPSPSSLSGASRLFPTSERSESDHIEWIVAWLSLQAMNKALKFLREMVAPITATAAMSATDIAKMFADAAGLVNAVVKKFPQERSLLKLPALNIQRTTVDISDSSSSSDDDYLPAGRMRMRVPSPRPAVRRGPVHFPIRPHMEARHFEQDVAFIMEALSCNRRQAIDALFASDGDPVKAMEDWFLVV